VRREGGEATLDVLLTAPQRCRVGIDLVRQRGADLSVRVESVEEGSAAAAAGIRAGDEIVSFAGRRLQFSDRRQLKAFDRALRTSINVGDIVPLTVRRAAEEGGSTEIELRLVAR
jgi:S1-C subfamily serine protease